MTHVIDSSAKNVYAVIADYRNGQPQILPRPPFVSLDVDEGGVGAGTVIRFRMRMLGATREMQANITEPEQGRVLVERDAAGDVVTMFTVEPTEEEMARVTISTDMKVLGGPLGWVQKTLISRLLKPVYVREIELLERVAAEWATGRSERSHD